MKLSTTGQIKVTADKQTQNGEMMFLSINIITPSAEEVAEEDEYSVWTPHPEGSF